MLRRSNGIERYVEIGPARILATMIQKSASQGYSSQAASHWSHFRFLSSTDNKKDIYYEYPEQVLHAATTDKTVDATGLNLASVSASLEVRVTPPGTLASTTNGNAVASLDGPVMGPVVAALAVPDAALSAAHVVLAITAQKLKKPFDQVSTQKTIRELSAGAHS